MTLLDLGTLERIALEHAPSPCILLEGLRDEIEQSGPISVSYVAGYCRVDTPPKERAFVRALLGCLGEPMPDRRRRSRRSSDLDAERKSVELMTALGESIGQIFGQLAGESYTEALNRRIEKHEPRAGEGRTDG